MPSAKRSPDIERSRSGIEARLFAPSEPGPLVFFRVVFGALMLWEVTRYLRYDWVYRYYIQPELFFSFLGFGWVRPWSGNGMYLHFLALGILAVALVLGLWYRVAAALFFLAFTYVFLLDQTNYLNHFYLISLLALILTFIPAHRAASLDALRRPGLAASTVPVWPLWLLRAQVGIAYLYSGIAKLNGDWLRGEPFRSWLAEGDYGPIATRFLTADWAPWFFSWGGLAFDLLVVPALLWRRSRKVAFLAAASFHLVNAYLFHIGIFPWLMIGATLLFFDADDFRGFRRAVERALGGAASSRPRLAVTPRARRVTVAVLLAYITVQLLVPLRHWLYPGNVSWTEEGHDFSWHMKLREKYGKVRFKVTDPATGETWIADQRAYLTERQRAKIILRPDMVVQFAHFLQDELRRQGRGVVEVRALTEISLNARPYQPLIDPAVDLTTVRRSILPASYLLPVEAAAEPELTAR